MPEDRQACVTTICSLAESSQRWPPIRSLRSRPSATARPLPIKHNRRQLLRGLLRRPKKKQPRRITARASAASKSTTPQPRERISFARTTARPRRLFSMSPTPRTMSPMFPSAPSRLSITAAQDRRRCSLTWGWAPNELSSLTTATECPRPNPSPTTKARSWMLLT